MRVPFDTVVSRHGSTILAVCRAVVGPNDAEDVWSETFLAALRAYPALPEDANVEAWLVTIAKRKGIDALRAGARRPDPVAEVPDRLDDAVHHGVRDDDLVAALAALTPRQREVIAYHVLVGLPYAEVAEIVGGTAVAARRAAADGLARLRSTYPLEARHG